MKLGLSSLLLLIAINSAMAETESKDFESQGLTSVLVENASGKVTISPLSGPKAKVTLSKNRFSDKCQITTERSGSKLVLKVEKPSRWFFDVECDVDFDIEVPKTVSLDLTVRSGNVSIKDIQGDLDFHVGSGNLFAEGSFQKVNGKTGSGKIAIKGLVGGGELKTGSGEIDLTFTNLPKEGAIDLTTGSGNAIVFLPKGSRVKTSLLAGSGEVSNDFGSNPEAAFLISMKAGSGNLKIKSY